MYTDVPDYARWIPRLTAHHKCILWQILTSSCLFRYLSTMDCGRGWYQFSSQGQYVSFIVFIFVFDLKWLNDFIFIYKHYINCHAKAQDPICLITINQNTRVSLDTPDQVENVA